MTVSRRQVIQLVIHGWILYSATSLGETRECWDYLVSGFNGVTDGSMSASSVYNGNFEASRARLYASGHTAAWIPYTTDTQQYIQVQFATPVMVVAVMIQGRISYQKWVTAFYLHHSSDGLTWMVHSDADGNPILLPGNTNVYTINTVSLGKNVTDRYFRLNPQTWEIQISLHFDLIGCRPPKPGDIMTGATCGAGDAHSSGTPDLAFGFCEGDIMTGATCGAGYAHSSGTPDLAFGFCEATHSYYMFAPVQASTIQGEIFSDQLDRVSCVKQCHRNQACESFSYKESTNLCKGYDVNYHGNVLTSSALGNISPMADTSYFFNLALSDWYGYMTHIHLTLSWKIYTARKTRDEAVFACQADRAQILAIKTPSQLTKVQDEIRKSTVLSSENGVYVAGDFVISSWIYWNSEAIPGELWLPGGPDASVGHCVVVTLAGLTSQACDSALFYVCGY